MTSDSGGGTGSQPEQHTEDDRVVSRRVPDRSSATPGDERAYAAAQPDHEPDPDPANDTRRPSGGSSEGARRELDAEAESEPDRSE